MRGAGVVPGRRAKATQEFPMIICEPFTIRTMNECGEVVCGEYLLTRRMRLSGEAAQSAREPPLGWDWRRVAGLDGDQPLLAGGMDGEWADKPNPPETVPRSREPRIDCEYSREHLRLGAAVHVRVWTVDRT